MTSKIAQKKTAYCTGQAAAPEAIPSEWRGSQERRPLLPPQLAFCGHCKREHSLPREPARKAATRLMTQLDQILGTDSLYGEARGKMFGVLVCKTPQGEQKTLKAFSGQYQGHWTIPGWVPPLFAPVAFKKLNDPMERQIKALGREATNMPQGASCRETVLRKRKELSQQLMKDIHALYILNNFNGAHCQLHDLFRDGRGIATGTGDCCAPKLLNFAALNDLQPLGLAEFYWGRSNRSASRQQGQFYRACADKCGPILGFLLCGIQPMAAHERTYHTP